MKLSKVFIVLSLLVAISAWGDATAVYAKSTPLVAKVRLHSIVDDIALVSTPVKGKDLAQLKRAGFRVVSKKKDIAPGTIYKKKLYVGYTTAMDSKALKRLRRKVGQQVQLKLRRVKNEKTIVIGVQ